MKAFRQNNYVKVIFDDGTSVDKEFVSTEEAIDAWNFVVHDEHSESEIKKYFLGEDPDKGKHLIEDVDNSNILVRRGASVYMIDVSELSIPQDFVENIIEAENAPSRARKLVDFGDILYSTVRPYLHNMCIINRSFSCKPIASTGFAVMTCFSGIYNKYLFYFLMSPIFDSYANATENAKGVAYPAINDNRLYQCIITLPPLAEQKRIVAKIEELLPLVDRYEQAWQRLEVLNSRFPVDMQKSVLQLAIQGRLVPQRPEEGTTRFLLIFPIAGSG